MGSGICLLCKEREPRDDVDGRGGLSHLELYVSEREGRIWKKAGGPRFGDGDVAGIRVEIRCVEGRTLLDG